MTSAALVWSGRIAGLALVAIGALAAWRGSAEILGAYYVAVAFWLDLALGGLALALVHGLTGGRWGTWIRPSLALLARALVPLLVAMAPLAYAYAAGGELERLAPAAGAYYSPAWLLARLALYFAVWIGVAALLARSSPARRTAVAAAGTVLYAITATLFAVDWLAASGGASFGTIVGFVLFGGQTTGALAAVLILVSLRSRAPERNAADRRQDVANLLLAAITFYGYALVMQLVIVWEANLPREIEWYVARGSALGVTAIVGLAATHGLAIALLVSRALKRRRRALLAIGALVLVGHLFDTWWWLAPALDGSPARPLDLVAIGVLGFGGWASCVRLGAAPVPALGRAT